MSSLERRKEVTSRRGGNTCGHTTKGVAKGMEEESGTRSMTKDTGVLWKGHSRQGMPVRAGVAYEGGNSIIRGV